MTGGTIKGTIWNEHGTMTLDGIEAETLPVTYATASLIKNNSTLVIDDSDLKLVTNMPSGSQYMSAIDNTNTLTISNSSITTDHTNVAVQINVHLIHNTGTATYNNTTVASNDLTLQDFSSYRSNYGIYNTGTFNFESGTIINKRIYSYALYNDGGTTIIKSGNITAEGTTAYGVYVNNGIVILGEAEPSTSPDYGKATAHVSTTDPYIEGIGSATGIGVKLNTGKLYFYDGKLVGNTSAKPDTATEVEHLYEATNYTDPDTGYEYCILIYMPNN